MELLSYFNYTLSFSLLLFGLTFVSGGFDAGLTQTYCKIYPYTFGKLAKRYLEASNLAIRYARNNVNPHLCLDQDVGTYYDGPFTAPFGYINNNTLQTQPVRVEELKYYNYFAAAVYCGNTVVNRFPLLCCPCQHFTKSLTYHRVIVNQTLGTKVLLTYHGLRKEIVVAFRGPVFYYPLLADVEYVLLGNEIRTNTSVHRGAYNCHKSVFPEVVSELRRMLQRYPQVERVTLTGHGLGGSMATLALFYFYYYQENRLPLPVRYKLITYGQPRTGNVPFADNINDIPVPVARVIHGGDFVPHLVRANYFNASKEYLHSNPIFVHFNREVWMYQNDLSPKFCNAKYYEFLPCSATLRAFQPGPGYNLMDHYYYFDVDYTTCTSQDFLETMVGYAELTSHFATDLFGNASYLDQIPPLINNLKPHLNLQQLWNSLGNYWRPNQ